VSEITLRSSSDKFDWTVTDINRIVQSQKL
jgi:hypothetical protein